MSQEVLSISIRFSSYDGSGKPTYNYTREEEVNSPELVLELPIRTRRSKNSLSRRPRRLLSVVPFKGSSFFGRDGSKEL